MTRRVRHGRKRVSRYVYVLRGQAPGYNHVRTMNVNQVLHAVHACDLITSSVRPWTQLQRDEHTGYIP